MMRPTLLALALLCTTSCDSMVTRPSLLGEVETTVQRRDGTPVRGSALILFTGARPMGYGSTDTSGRFRFRDVPYGVYGVRAVPPEGYTSTERVINTGPADVADQLRVTGGDRVAASITLLKVGPGSVRVEVRDQAGQPLADIPLVLFAPSGPLARDTTDATGRAQFTEVPFGNVGVFAERPARFRDVGEPPLVAVDGLLVDEGSIELAAFRLERCEGRIRITVQDQQGDPVTAGRLVLYTGQGAVSDDSLPASGIRDYGPLLCNDYGVRFVPVVGWRADEVPGSAFRDGLRISRRDSLRVTTLRVTRTGRGTVAIRVEDAAAAPVADVRVQLYTGAGVLRDTVTSTSGTVSFSDLPVELEYGARVVLPPGGSMLAGTPDFVDGLRLTNGGTRSHTFRIVRP